MLSPSLEDYVLVLVVSLVRLRNQDSHWLAGSQHPGTTSGCAFGHPIAVRRIRHSFIDNINSSLHRAPDQSSDTYPVATYALQVLRLLDPLVLEINPAHQSKQFETRA